MKLTFLGTGTSTGVPMVGCGCAVCRSADPRNRRRRASVLLENPQGKWIIDVGPDFRNQALEAGLDSLDGVFLTHGHADHVLGLDDLRPLSWKKSVPVWADGKTTATIRQTFPYFFTPGDGKTSRPKLDFRMLFPGVPVAFPGFSVSALPICHGDAMILGFRIGRLAYLTDCNGIPDATLACLDNLDFLVLGALRPQSHPTHFNLNQAVAAARTVGARQTFFTHFSHDVDHSTWAAVLPPGMAPAYDGLTLEF